jgi:hypothetical protein
MRRPDWTAALMFSIALTLACSDLVGSTVRAEPNDPRVIIRADANPEANASRGQDAATENGVAGDEQQSDDVDQAIKKAIGLIRTLQREDGAFTEGAYDTTMTSLGLMAMASCGITPDDPGEDGQSMRRALAYVLGEDRQNEQGYFGERDGSRMYGHGITTLMLTEMLGMGADEAQDQLIHQRCQRGIDLILSAQKQEKAAAQQGGWRYTPDAHDSDLSVSVWQLMALRSAKNDGLEVPSEAIDDAVEYLKRSFTSKLDRQGQPVKAEAGFSYEPQQDNPTYTMTAAGLLAMQVCGQYDSPLVAHSADWLIAHPPQWNERFFFYGTYYYAQGMYQRGGTHHQTAQRLVKEQLLPHQRDDGSWLADGGEEGGHGRIYSTALAVLSLSVKYHYLPIYQR